MDLALNNLQKLICHKNQPTTPVNTFLESPTGILKNKRKKVNISIGSIY